ncbi:MAG TPA: glycoside hydrolase family 75 protein [Drouetiella sp.]
MTFESPNSSRHTEIHRYAEGSPEGDLSRHVQSHFHSNHHHHHHGHHGHRHHESGGTEQDGAATPGEAADNGGKKFGGALEQLSQNRAGQILDKSSSPEDKLTALREMSKAGKNNFEVRGADGESYKMRIEREQSGSHEMVHLWMTGPDGKERVAMRGIADENGKFKQEQDKSGNPVDWYGSGGQALQKLYGDGTSSGGAPAREEDGSQGDSGGRSDSGSDRNSGGKRAWKGNPRERETDQQDAPSPLDRIPNPFKQNDRPPVPRAGDNPSWLPQDLLDAQGSQAGRQALDKAAADARQQTHHLIGTDSGVYLRSGMTVDADGSPRARQIDPDGQANTSMRYANNKSLNAEVVPYMVLPAGKYQQHGIKLGDMVLVRNTDTGKMAVAVFGDVGPGRKSGEGSMALAAEIGLNPSPTRGGTTRPTIEYLVLPNTHGTKPQNQDELMSRIQEQRNRFGIA